MTHIEQTEEMLTSQVLAYRILIDQRLEEIGIDLADIDPIMFVMALPSALMFAAFHANELDAEAVMQSHALLDETIEGTINAIRRLRG